MEYHMPYGKDQISITIPDSVKQVDLKLPPQPIVKYPEKLLYSTFENPIQSETLKNILETNNPYSIVVVVDDQTRKFPHRVILVPLLKFLETHGIAKTLITILVATGVHRQPTPTQLEYLFGSEITENYRITWNDQENGEFINYGTTSRGTPVKLNSIYANADLKILITDVTLHYFAGFGGDRKSIFPGVASASSINKNHSLVMHGIYPGQIED
ncbi:MAG: lactate racemase domain-containing protein, partial [Promethearchaeota archaeon]